MQPLPTKKTASGANPCRQKRQEVQTPAETKDKRHNEMKRLLALATIIMGVLSIHAQPPTKTIAIKARNLADQPVFISDIRFNQSGSKEQTQWLYRKGRFGVNRYILVLTANKKSRRLSSSGLLFGTLWFMGSGNQFPVVLQQDSQLVQRFPAQLDPRHETLVVIQIVHVGTHEIVHSFFEHVMRLGNRLAAIGACQ